MFLCISICACIWQSAPPRRLWVCWPNLMKKLSQSFYLLQDTWSSQEEGRRPVHVPSGERPQLSWVQGIHVGTTPPGTAVEDIKLQWFCCSIICFKDRPEQSFPLTILTGHRGFWNLCVVDFTLIHCKMNYSPMAQQCYPLPEVYKKAINTKAVRKCVRVGWSSWGSTECLSLSLVLSLSLNGQNKDMTLLTAHAGTYNIFPRVSLQVCLQILFLKLNINCFWTETYFTYF